CALAGSLLVGFSGSAAGGGSNHLLGGALALINAFSIAAYLLIGRKLAGRLPSLPYSWIVFTTAAFITLLMILVSGTPLFGYSLYEWWLIVLIAFVAQFLGHLPINAALRYFTATHLNMAMQLSVLVSALFAFFLLGEIPTILQVVGSLIILVGVTLVSRK
ncbi:MAG: DMT family transporter, partial [Anaerolineales bacterium]|nr:DMT family transporter [Anaerolineales bacterium]